MSGLRRSRSRSVHSLGYTHPEPRALIFCCGVSQHDVAFATHLLSVLQPQGWQE